MCPMNKHIVIDNLTADIAALISSNKKFFSRSIESKTFPDLVKSVRITIPDIPGEGTFNVDASIIDTTLDPAFRVEKWIGPGHPTVIYHHGNNERPFDYRKGAKNTFLNIFVKEIDSFNANLIVARAPYHNMPIREYQEKMLYLNNFMTMLSASVKLNEAIVQQLKEKSSAPVITSGISLGGWVTNLHRSFYNSSDFYVPLLAGTYLAELFMKSKYRKLTGKPAKENPEKVRGFLNFNVDFKKVTEKNVFPLLARFDRFIEYDVQEKSYPGHPVKVFDAGHVTGAINSGEIRRHLLEVLNRAQPQE